jgi:hypothetical protein
MKFVGRVIVLGLAWLGGTLAATAVEPLRPQDLEKLRTVIKPGAGEDRWATIPWLTDLWQARQLAARQGKPILLWEMDGNPLGCT